MKESFKKIIAATGEDLERDGLKRTPERAAAAFEFMTSGYQQSLTDIIDGALFDSDNNEMVIMKDIDLYSLCEHHLLPFIGKCHVAYLPQGKILGFSRIAKIVDHFARRLQVQENLTKNIAEALMDITQGSGVAVIIEAKHLCMLMPNAEKHNAIITTSMMLGMFRNDPKTRAEFLNLIK